MAARRAPPRASRAARRRVDNFQPAALRREQLEQWALRRGRARSPRRRCTRRARGQQLRASCRSTPAWMSGLPFERGDELFADHGREVVPGPGAGRHRRNVRVQARRTGDDRARRADLLRAVGGAGRAPALARAASSGEHLGGEWVDAAEVAARAPDSRGARPARAADTPASSVAPHAMTPWLAATHRSRRPAGTTARARPWRARRARRTDRRHRGPSETTAWREWDLDRSGSARGERGRARRVGVDDGVDIGAARVDREVEADLAEHPAAADDLAGGIDRDAGWRSMTRAWRWRSGWRRSRRWAAGPRGCRRGRGPSRPRGAGGPISATSARMVRERSAMSTWLDDADDERRMGDEVALGSRIWRTPLPLASSTRTWSPRPAWA